MHRIGPGPVIQCWPLKPTAPGARSDSAPVVTATAELSSPPTAASCLLTSTRHTCNNQSCATSLAGARTLAKRA
jgi:hypothetical protein